MSNRLPPEEYKALCKAVLQRDKYRCRSCGSRNYLHVHHVVFRSQQGEDAAWNLVTVCSSCHDGIHKFVKYGVYGLVVAVTPYGFAFQKNWGWRPN